jgi:hypothetical protein
MKLHKNHSDSNFRLFQTFNVLEMVYKSVIEKGWFKIGQLKANKELPITSGELDSE